MEQSKKQRGRGGREGYVLGLALTAAGILINFIGVRIALALELPVFLDSIGTMLAAALGGYIPGIAAGFLTNIINGISDYTTTYYGVLSVLMAICTAGLYSRDGFRKPRTLALAVVLLALIGGGLGSVLTWCLYGGGIGEGISAPLAYRILALGATGPFLSQLSADMLIDLLDKAVSVLIVALTLRLIPAGVRERMRFRGWRQAPLTEREYSRAGHRSTSGLSLQTRITILLGAAAMLIAVVVTGISFMQFHEANIEQQSRLGVGVANVVASNIDPERVDEFLALGAEAEGYSEIEDNLARIIQSTPDIEFVYVYKILPDGCHVVFDPDTPDVPGAEPGEVIPFDGAFERYLPALLAGEEVEPVISDETYGWLLTVYLPIYDREGACQCYAAVDISMAELVANERVFLARVIALFLGFFILILALGVWLAEYRITLPINSMAMASGAFAYDSEAARADSIEQIRRLDIRTGDEIENLYRAIVKTTEDTVRYIAEAQQKNETISKLQNGLIMVLADLVESRDKCTGDHVRKTAAYTRIIMEQMRREGIYADRLTDAFVADVVSSAPLHDIGKIKVSDALLNKPGRLTEEEFEIMRRHTSDGGEIITHAIGAVSDADSGYLLEARNLANYHHEKWDGSGYPTGLRGEEIPLSARIMAVADVFDALVSTRSYKKAFPIEKALDIIREGAGSHFDPNVARAFLDAEEEVRRIAQQHEGSLFD